MLNHFFHSGALFEFAASADRVAYHARHMSAHSNLDVAVMLGEPSFSFFTVLTMSFAGTGVAYREGLVIGRSTAVAG